MTSFANLPTPVLYEQSVEGRRGVRLPACDVDTPVALPKGLMRESAPGLCELSEPDIVRHFTRLSQKNTAIDTHFYPLGSCTMKHNPRINEKTARLPQLAGLHPMLYHMAKDTAGDKYITGTLTILQELEEHLCEISGMDAVTTQPLAGSHGEMLGIMLVAAYHKSKGSAKNKIIIPDTSHGTNPASAAMMGYEIITIPTAEYGDLDLDVFREKMDDSVAAVMMTNPNTLGLFNPYIGEIAELAHKHDALMYYDGANLNAILGKVRPGDLGFDIVHINVHKTYSTPHGSGGPGAGPVGVKEHLIPFLPGMRIIKKNGLPVLSPPSKQSVGALTSFLGNAGILVRAWTYAIQLGKEGLQDAAERAVLNANYIKALLADVLPAAWDQTCMHECVLTAEKYLKSAKSEHESENEKGDQNSKGFNALDIAKALIDEGFHPPTVYFPINVHEAIMIEPTETENKQTLDDFAAAVHRVIARGLEDPTSLHEHPKSTPVTRLDETLAARQPNIRYQR